MYKSAGTITRSCLIDGDWQEPLYNCVRDAILSLASDVRFFFLSPNAPNVHCFDGDTPECTLQNSPPCGHSAPGISLICLWEQPTDNHRLECCNNSKDQGDFRGRVCPRGGQFCNLWTILQFVDNIARRIQECLRQSGGHLEHIFERC